MSVPIIHAQSSAKRFGGKPEDYIDIHRLMDSSGEAFSDLRHRALTHTSWFIKVMIPRVFGELRNNSAGEQYSTVLVAQWHVLEDYDGRFIPSVQDFLSAMRLEPWMDNGKNGASPPSQAEIPKAESPRASLDQEHLILTPEIEGKPVPTEEPRKDDPSEPVRGCRGGPPGAFD